MRPGRWCGALTLLVAATIAVPATAGAEVRTATVSDPEDPTVLLDIEQYRVQFDRDAGRLTFTARLHRPWPEAAPAAEFPYLTTWIAAADPGDCVTAEHPGATSISIDRDPSSGDWSASYHVDFRQEHPDTPITFSADRREATVTISDPLLVGADLRCIDGASSGRGSYDPSRPDGGETYDSLDASWFDGFAPAPPPAPGGLGGPGAPTERCQNTTARITAPPARMVPGRAAAVAWRPSGTYGDPAIVGATVTQQPSNSDPVSSTYAGSRGSVPVRPTIAGTPLRINLRWTEHQEGRKPCMGERDFKVRAVEGDLPRIFDQAVSRATRRLEFTLPDECIAARRRPVSVRIEGPGGSRRARLSWGCGRWTSRPAGLPGLRLRTIGAASSVPSLVLSAGRSGTYRESFRVVVRGAKRPWRRTVRVDSRRTPSRRVWWESDEYVNYCINEGRRVYSAGGRLYCVRPGFTRQSLRIVR